MNQTDTKPQIASRRPLVGAGSLLVVLLVITALPGVAAAAAAESRFLTENSLAEVSRREDRAELRSRRDEDGLDRVQPPVAGGFAAEASGRPHPAPVTMKARLAAFGEASPVSEPPPPEPAVTPMRLDLPPPAR